MLDRKPNGYWKNEENVVAEARKVITDNGLDRFPSRGQLLELDRSDLDTAITANYGGYRKLRNVLGEEQIRTEKGKWKDLDYTIQEARRLMERHEYSELPNIGTINDLGYSSLSAAIVKYHGGFAKFRRNIGQRVLKRKNGELKDVDEAISEARRIIKENNLVSLPSSPVLMEMGYSGFVGAVQKYHGGLSRFRLTLGEQQKEREKGTWNDLNFVLSEACRVMKENGFGTLPSFKQLLALGHSSLGSAINEKHGGFRKFREMIGDTQKRTENGKWKDVDFTVSEVGKLMNENGFDDLPSHGTLAKFGRSDLVNAIYRYHGGIERFRELLRQRSGKPKESERIENVLRRYVG